MADVLLIPDECRGPLLKAVTKPIGRATQADLVLEHRVRNAPTFRLPEVCIFRDGNGERFLVVAWTKEEAKLQAAKEKWRPGPLMLEQSQVLWPGIADNTIPLGTTEEPLAGERVIRNGGR